MRALGKVRTKCVLYYVVCARGMHHPSLLTSSLLSSSFPPPSRRPSMHLSRMRIAMHLDRTKVALGIEYSIRLRRASNSSKSVMWLHETDAVPCTKIHYKACTWLREFSSCSHLTALPGLALVLPSTTCKPFSSPVLYSAPTSPLLPRSNFEIEKSRVPCAVSVFCVGRCMALVRKLLYFA